MAGRAAAVVGHDAVRQDARERVRGEARYTADIQLPGMLHTAVLRSPHAHARVKQIDLAPALALPGVHGALGPGEAKGLEEEAGLLRRAQSRRSRPTRSRRPAVPSRRSRSSGNRSMRFSTRRRLYGESSSQRRPPVRARGLRQGARVGRRRHRGHVPHLSRASQLDGDAPVGLRVGRRHAQRLHLDAVHLGRAQRRRGGARDPGQQRACRLRVHGRRLRRRRTIPANTRSSRPSSQSAPDARCGVR